MTAKPIFRRQAAEQDIADALTYYLGEAGEATALGLIDALEAALDQIKHNPKAGSNRYAYALQIEGLKAWSLKRYPYLVFYMEYAAQIEVWRVLHGQRDIPAWLAEPE